MTGIILTSDAITQLDPTGVLLEKGGVVAVVLLVIWLLYRIVSSIVKEGSLAGIRTEVYKLFLKAERAYKESGTGEEKMQWVIDQAWALLPGPARFLISKSMLRVVVQKWFDAIKDLLDDGKMNNSVSGTSDGTETGEEE